MGKVKFELSVEKLTFKFEGDQGTGHAVNRAMNHTLGSLLEAQNRVIDVTPSDPVNQPALPAASKKRRHRSRPKPAVNGDSAPPDSEDSNGHSKTKPPKPRRHRGEGFRTLVYRALGQGYFATPRSAAEIQAEFSTLGFNIPMGNITSDLTNLTQKQILARQMNSDGKYAYTKGFNDDYPRS